MLAPVPARVAKANGGCCTRTALSRRSGGNLRGAPGYLVGAGFAVVFNAECGSGMTTDNVRKVLQTAEQGAG